MAIEIETERMNTKKLNNTTGSARLYSSLIAVITDA
jgi:hypothetical protein